MKEIQKDKHGFTVTKYKISFRIVVKFLLTAAVCIYALYRCSLRAYADNTYTLTPEQTVALYGTSLSADYYNYGSFVETVTFNYIGKTSDYGSSQYGEKCSVLSVSNDYQTSIQAVRATINQYDYLIYHYSAQNWSTANALQFTINQPSLLRGITGYSGGVLFSCGDYQTTGSNYMYVSDCIYYTSKGSKTFRAHTNNNNGPTIVKIALAVPDSFGYVADNDILACQYMAMNDPYNVRFDGQEFDMNSFSINWGSAGGRWWSGVTGGATNLYIMLPCPVLYDYEPPVTTAPVTTTAPATTRRQYSILPPVSTAPANTVDLSQLESGVAAIVEQAKEANNNLDWIGGNMYIGVNNLAHIANTLDAIYNEMWKAGEIPLNAGLDPPANQNLHDFVLSALATHTNTVSQSSYDLRGGMSTYFDIGNSLLSSPLFRPFVMVAAVGLALAVLAFVLFRGY